MEKIRPDHEWEASLLHNAGIRAIIHDYDMNDGDIIIDGTAITGTPHLIGDHMQFGKRSGVSRKPSPSDSPWTGTERYMASTMNGDIIALNADNDIMAILELIEPQEREGIMTMMRSMPSLDAIDDYISREYKTQHANPIIMLAREWSHTTESFRMRWSRSLHNIRESITEINHMDSIIRKCYGDDWDIKASRKTIDMIGRSIHHVRSYPDYALIKDAISGMDIDTEISILITMTRFTGGMATRTLNPFLLSLIGPDDMLSLASSMTRQASDLEPWERGATVNYHDADTFAAINQNGKDNGYAVDDSDIIMARYHIRLCVLPPLDRRMRLIEDNGSNMMMMYHIMCDIIKGNPGDSELVTNIMTGMESMRGSRLRFIMEDATKEACHGAVVLRDASMHNASMNGIALHLIDGILPLSSSSPRMPRNTRILLYLLAYMDDHGYSFDDMERMIPPAIPLCHDDYGIISAWIRNPRYNTMPFEFFIETVYNDKRNNGTLLSEAE